MSADQISPCLRTIEETAPLIASGALSPVALAEAFLERIERLNPHLDAYVTVCGERALTDARHAEAEIRSGRYRGPLHGIPYALKDIYDTAGIRTTSGSHLHAERVPERDAFSVARLRDAGMVLLGKLTTHEFAFGGPSWDLPDPPARNPWNPDHFTGGSSSGSGAATAAGLAMATLGSDTGGSIRMPAYFCGTSGIKPTYGRVSRRGVSPLSYSQDHCGPLTWTARDGALVLQALAGWDPEDPGSAARAVPDFSAGIGDGVAGMRIGHVRHFYDGDTEAEPGVKASVAEALDVLARLGATVEEVSLSPLQVFHAANITITLSEGLAVHERDLRERPECYGEVFRARLLCGIEFTATDLVQAQRLRRRLEQEVSAALAGFDVLITAGGHGPAPALAATPPMYMFERPLLTTPFNLTGHPVVSVCTGFVDGLPVGMQVIGAAFDEASALRVAASYEAATPYRSQRPVVGA